LTFSIWKHSCLVVVAVLMLAHIVDGTPLNPGELFEGIAVSWVFLMLSAYLIPQLLFRRTSGRWLGALQPFLTGSALVMRPLVLAFGFLHSLLDVVKQEPQRDEAATSAENIEALISAGAEGGLIEEDDRKLIQSVVAFGDKIVREIMTPRPSIVAIQADKTLEALRELVMNEQYSRIPAYETTLDDIAGFVHVRDMFETPESDRKTRTVRELIRPISFIPETKPVDDLMREMQQDGAHMAIVVDEYGNTAGLATMEDVLEVILGEIRDEHEPESDVTEDGQGGYLVSGNFDLSRIADLVEFRPDENVESTTIGGLVMEWLGRVPVIGESIERDGIRIEVIASDEMRIEQVRLSKAPAKTGQLSPASEL
ncbi:MAG: hemolysin family protein, partial [Acidobacteriota bacterium]|nr:hemolysin family protein [Acidobacteriota bacterium]